MIIIYCILSFRTTAASKTSFQHSLPVRYNFQDEILGDDDITWILLEIGGAIKMVIPKILRYIKRSESACEKRICAREKEKHTLRIKNGEKRR